jgi:hypothetical protein
MSVVIVHPNGELTMDTIQHYKTYGSFQHCWKTLTHEIHLYGKKKGKAGDENKYEFPPPVDNILFFKSCLLINPSGDLTLEMWNDFYESIMQLEDIETDEEDHEYLKDDFVADNELEEEPYKN